MNRKVPRCPGAMLRILLSIVLVLGASASVLAADIDKGIADLEQAIAYYDSQIADFDQRRQEPHRLFRGVRSFVQFSTGGNRCVSQIDQHARKV